jgi:hypothetical protein
VYPNCWSDEKVTILNCTTLLPPDLSVVAVVLLLRLILDKKGLQEPQIRVWLNFSGIRINLVLNRVISWYLGCNSKLAPITKQIQRSKTFFLLVPQLQLKKSNL